MEAPQAALLPDGQRLHLHHGPIDLIIEVFGNARDACYARAVGRFQTILSELADELTALRRQTGSHDFKGATARQMAQATRRFDRFVTPMAAVAGSVADEMLTTMIAGEDVEKAYVNNGGDVAFHLSPGQSVEAAGASGPIVIKFEDAPRGLATSGWRGRSHSLGIADAVTVAARNAATADAAATLIANAVDLPNHPKVLRSKATDLSPDSDLGDRLVTTEVGALTEAEAQEALSAGATYAEHLIANAIITEASLTLQGQTIIASDLAKTKDLTHA